MFSREMWSLGERLLSPTRVASRSAMRLAIASRWDTIGSARPLSSNASPGNWSGNLKDVTVDMRNIRSTLYEMDQVAPRSLPKVKDKGGRTSTRRYALILRTTVPLLHSNSRIDALLEFFLQLVDRGGRTTSEGALLRGWNSARPTS
jgi:hypothetical protein